MEKDGKHSDNNSQQLYTCEAEVSAPSVTLASRTALATRDTFKSLKYPNFLHLWIGGWFSNTGTWVQAIALNWLVYEISKSPSTLGLVQFASSIPVFFLSFYAGALTDKINRRNIIVWSNFIAMALAFMLGFFVSYGLITIAIIILLSFLSGISFSFAFPSWQSMISDVVPKKDLMNAIALNATQFHAARLLGPAIAGYIIASIGLDWAFYLNGMSFFAVIAALLYIEYRPKFETKSNSSSFRAIGEGFTYAWHNRQILNYLLAVGIVSIFGLAFFSTLMPIFAGEILKVGVKGYSWLMSVNGIGALFSSLVVAWLSGRAELLSVLRTVIPALGLAILVFSFSQNFYLSMFAIFLTGFFFLMTVSMLNTAIQSVVDNTFRGRVMSIFVWMFMGLSPFGALGAGILGKHIGESVTVAIGAGVILVLGLYINVRLVLKRKAP